MEKFEVFETDNQRKKHVSQMSKEEIAFLDKKLRKIRRIVKSRHLLNRRDTGRVPIRVFKEILRDPSRRNIIEYNETTKHGLVSKRILVRDSKTVKTRFYQSHTIEAEGDASLCFVIDYETGVIVTAYYNYANDDHETLNPYRYDATLNCIKKEKLVTNY